MKALEKRTPDRTNYSNDHEVVNKTAPFQMWLTWVWLKIKQEVLVHVFTYQGSIVVPVFEPQPPVPPFNPNPQAAPGGVGRSPRSGRPRQPLRKGEGRMGRNRSALLSFSQAPMNAKETGNRNNHNSSDSSNFQPKTIVEGCEIHFAPPKTPGNDAISLQTPTNNGFPWFAVDFVRPQCVTWALSR